MHVGPLAVAAVLLVLSAAPGAATPRTYQAGPSLVDNFVGSLDANLAVAVSSDDRHVYVASRGAIEAFARDAGSGKLALVQEVVAGNPSGTVLVDAQHLTISPDGAHLYVADRFAPALSVFARDSITGLLTFVEARTNGAGGVFGLNQPTAVAVSPDGLHVYATSGGFTGVGAIVAFSRNPVSGALTFVDTLLDGGAGGSNLSFAEHVTVSPDGASVYVAGSSAISLFDRDAGTGALTYVEAYENGVGGVQGLSGCSGVVVSPDGAHVYTTGNNEFALSLFQRNATTGQLTFTQLYGGGQRPEEVTLDATGSHVYVVSSGLVAVYARAPGTGTLTFIQSLMSSIPGFDDLYLGFGIAVSPDGDNVYTAAFGGAVVTFARDPGTGTLAFAQRLWQYFSAIGLTGLSAVAVSGDGAHVYATGDEDDAIVFADRDAGTGALAYVDRYADGFDGLTGLAGPRSLAISPDDAHVYVASAGSQSLSAFARTPGTGALALVDQEFDGVAGVHGLTGAEAVVVSGDGAHVYVAASGDNAVSAFGRNAATGALTYLGVWAEGFGGVSGLSDPRSLALSPAGEHVYVASAGSDGVAVFARDAGTGLLAFLGSVVDADLMDGARALAVSPDGANVYVGAQASASLVTFARDGVTGLLAFVDVQTSDPQVAGTNGNLGFLDLRSPRAVLVSADGAMVLVANDEDWVPDESVTVFARDPIDGRALFVHVLASNAYSQDVAGTRGFGGLAESPDGAHVYWGAEAGYALTPLAASFSGCSTLPLPGCRLSGEGGGATLTVIDNPPPGTDSIAWRWRALGEPTAVLDFGDPTDATHYGLCLYDESGAPVLAARALAPAGPQRWKEIEDSSQAIIGFKMRDRRGQPEGVSVVAAKAKRPGAAKVKMKAKGVQVRVPVLPPGLPLRVQLQTAGAACWEASFSAAGVRTNAGGRFVATSD